MFEQLHVEVDQQPSGQSAELEAADELRVVHRQKRFDSLEFHQDGVVHNQIGAIAALQTDTFVVKANGLLPLKANLPQLQFATES